MSSPSEALADMLPEQAGAARSLRRTWPYYWSVRREIWEHRELYLAPLIAAGVVLLGVVLSLGHLGHTEITLNGRAAHTPFPTATPELIAAFAVFVTTFLVAFFYCLGALNNERRDRSILFWKSLPVSDLTTVLSKATVPVAVLPVVAFVVIALVQLVIVGLEAAFPALHPAVLAPALDRQLTLPWIVGMEAYLLVVLSIWYAPVWGWLLLVSAWSRRGTFLWAVLAPLAVCVVERLALGTAHVWELIGHRLSAAAAASAALSMPTTPEHAFTLPSPDPAGFVTDLQVWAGLVFAALCLAGAVWLRRRREPI